MGVQADVLKYGEPITKAYLDLESDLINNIARKLADFGNASTPASEWQIKKLAQLGKLNQENIRIIAEATGRVPELTRVAVAQAAYDAVKTLEPTFQEAARRGILMQAPDVSVSPNMQRTVGTYAGQAAEAWNLTNTTMLVKTQEVYVQVINKTALSVISGAQTRQQAVQQTVREFSARGIPAFIDKAGREWSPEGYVNMVVRTTMSNTANAAQDARMMDYGADVIEVSSHAGARPGCELYQGRFFSISGKTGTIRDVNGQEIPYTPLSGTTYGQPSGLFGINCHHEKYAAIPGMFERRNQPTMNKAENDKAYKESQQQRAIERDIRTAKRQVNALKEAGADTADASAKLRQEQARMRQFIDDTGRTRRSDRERVY